MIAEIQELDKRISAHCKSEGYDEKLFNLGVELGRLLAEHNIASHRPAPFIEFESQKDIQASKNKQIQRANKAISFLIRNALAEQIEQHGEFCFDSNTSTFGCEKIEESIVAKFFVQIDRTTQREHGGSFEAEFILSGQLEPIFNKYGIDLYARADVENTTGAEEETIYNADDVDKIFGVSLRLNGHTTDLDELQLGTFADELEKITSWLTLKIVKSR